MNRVQQVMQAVSDRANPVVVKELRQAVQSRLVIAILLLFLLANVIGVTSFLMFNVNAATSERAGQDLFSGLFVVLVITCMVFVPLYAATRLTMERNDSNIDLLFITTIAPAAIIRGKFWSALALTALIYSAAMPFLTCTYLLRGIDLPSIFLALGTAFLCTAIAIMLAIFVGSVAGGLLLRILMFGGLLYTGACLMAYAIFAGLAIAHLGLASMFTSDDAWAVTGILALVGLSGWGILYLLAVAAVSARSSNRMFPVRVFVTICWLIFGIALGTWSWCHSSTEFLTVWVVASTVLLSLTLAFTLAERENWTPRVRRHIPRSHPLRFLAWLFFTGSAGGVIWCCTLCVATLLIGHVMIGQFTSSIRSTEAQNALHVMGGVLLYAWCYSMSGLFVRRMIVPKSIPLVGTTIGIALLAIGGSVPLFLAFLIFGPTWQFETLPIHFVIANPFVLGRLDSDAVVIVSFLAVWTVLGLFANMPWFREQWQAFRRYEPKPVPTAACVTEDPPVVHV